ncbi:cardiolipin synthase [Aquibacillus sediminis]|uniref:cardiolipin synthase n=1 Tax=Aquibacillus sediminis TaxID=2574734 RepID=UPI00148756DF|nr:cardiolipin synthase [Aquibacillus sediminis]
MTLSLMILAIIVILGFLIYLDLRLGYNHFQKKAPVFSFNSKKASYNLKTDGDEFFSSLFEDIEQAQTSVDVQFFIVRNDGISLELFNILKRKAGQGITVRLVVDRIGSFQLKKTIIKDLQASGVKFAFSDKPAFPYFFFQLNRRNHRKITVIDEKIGYLGGFNVGKEYLGKDPKLGPWRDYHMRITGDAVSSLVNVFTYDWNRANNLPAEVTKEKDKSASSDEKMDIVVTEAGQLEDFFVDYINNAKRELLIGSPYFIPSKRMFQALLDACDRGVDVKLTVPMKEDHPFVKPAGIPYMKKLSEAGGEVYLYDNGFYHAKVILIDEQFCDLGTANFDMRSVYINKEMNIVIDHDADFIKKIRSAYFNDIKSCLPFTEKWVKQQPIMSKLSGIIAQVIKPLL